MWHVLHATIMHGRWVELSLALVAAYKFRQKRAMRECHRWIREFLKNKDESKTYSQNRV